MKNTKENNRIIIAPFMDVKTLEEECTNCGGYGHTDRDGFTPCTCCDGKGMKHPTPKYDEEWGRLMPVVENIITYLNNHEKVRKDLPVFGFIKGNARLSMPHGFVITGEGETLLKSTYDVVIQFIKWYNENK